MSQDPTPGDPEEIRRLESRYREIGDKARTAAGILGQGGAVETGRGDAMDALRKQLSDLPEKLKKTEDSFTTAADAYRTYVSRLTEAQGMIDQAMDQAIPVADEAGRTVGELPPDATDEQKSAAKQQQDGVSAAQEKLSSARRLAEDARSLRESASRAAGDTLDDAAGQAIPERNIFQKIADFFKDFPFIQIILAALVAITAVFFPVVGALLGGALFIFNQVVAGQTGNLKLGDLLVGLVALIPGGSLLKAGSALVTKVAPGLFKAGSGFVKSFSGTIAKVSDTFGKTRVGGAVLNTQAGKIGTEVVGKFATGTAEEAAVKALNKEKITAGNILAGAAAGALAGGAIKGVDAFRKRGTAGAAGAGDAAASPAPVTPPTPKPAPAGAGTSLGDRLRAAKDPALEQLGELTPEAAAIAAKIGVAVSEGSSFGEALNQEGANLIPKAAGSVGKTGLGDRIDGFIPTKTSTPDPAPPVAPPRPDSPAPLSPVRPEPQDVPLPPSPTTPTAPNSPTISASPEVNTTPSSPTTRPPSVSPPQSPVPSPPASPTSGDSGFTTAPSSPVSGNPPAGQGPSSPASPPAGPASDDGFVTAPSSPVTDRPQSPVRPATDADAAGQETPLPPSS
ncbi:hypothetical protein ABZ707_08300 [Streptomyces sp. NPDC006923]|uniref:hypothetical protein n=1 Tax=Streptomyces sp. NPDC006923 TaxID=3155355 RepID=UPI0033E8128F